MGHNHTTMSDISQLPEYYKNPRMEVLEAVPTEIKTQLDIGCASGAFGAAVKERSPVEVWGIEMNAEVAEHAKSRLDKVFVGDALAIFPDLPSGKFDLITCNDVLEHMPQPDQVLRNAVRLLAPGGRVLMSLPNIRYWDAFLRIARDADFPQEDSGIFDRTHLRFFTGKSIKRFLPENGYEIVSMKGINPTPSRKLRALNLLTANRFEDCKYLQYLILAKPRV
jgi:2-polyprenyl-3-methyl-5-hydroxy-6-metoxy-1,4-benzoquinol methylase